MRGCVGRLEDLCEDVRRCGKMRRCVGRCSEAWEDEGMCGKFGKMSRGLER